MKLLITSLFGLILVALIGLWAENVSLKAELVREQSRIIMLEEFQARLIWNGFNCGPKADDAKWGPGTKMAHDAARAAMPDPWAFYSSKHYASMERKK